MKLSLQLLRLPALFMLSLCVLSGNTLAQSSKTLEEIIITAQKKEESLLDSAIDVSVFSGEELEKYAISDMSGIALSVPGLTFQNTGAWAQIYLRGVGTRVSQAGLDPGVAVYVDDRYVGRQSGIMFGMTDMERIEVLKGPQGVLFGRNSTGGAIRLISNPVSDEMEGKVTMSLGDYDYKKMEGMLNVPISDNFAIRGTFQHREREAFKKNIIPGGYDYDDLDQTVARLRAKWTISNQTSLEISHLFATVNDLSNMGAVSADSGNARGIALGGITTTRRDQIASSATAVELNPDGPKHYMDSTAIRLETSMAGHDVAIFVNDSMNDERRFGDYDGNSFNDIDVMMTENKSDETGAGLEISSNNDGPLNWIVGMNYFDQTVDYDFDLRIGAIGGGNVAASTGWITYNLETYGVFASFDYELSDRLTLNIGGRYTKEEKDALVRCSQFPGYAQNSRLCLAAALKPNYIAESWTSFDPKVTLAYNLENNGIIYATFASGFKSGGFNAPSNRGAVALEPEEIDMIELGYKAELSDTLSLTSSFFIYDYTDLQVTRAASGGGTVTTENATDSDIMGIDFNITWLASDNLMVRFGGEFLDTEYTDYTTAARVANTILQDNPDALNYGYDYFNAEGETLLRAADLSWFLAADYQSGPMSVNISYSWTDEYDFDFVRHPASDSLRQKAHGILNARATFDAGNGMSIALWGKNIADEVYLNDSVIGGTNQRINYAHPRTWGIDLTYDF